MEDKIKDKDEKEKKELSLEQLQKQLEECGKLRDDYLSGWQRCKADFLNYKREEEERIKWALSFAKAEWMLKLLSIFDNLKRARENLPEALKESDWVKGVLQIENQFKEFLEREGVEEIKTEGQKFNPDFHEAIEITETKEKEPGSIIGVVQKGYLLNGRVLRPAKVKVVK